MQSSGKKTIEDLLEGFIARSEDNYKALDARNKNQEAMIKEQRVALRNLDVQVGHLAKNYSDRSQGEFPSDTQEPRIENASAITTRSGRVLSTVEKLVEEVVGEEERIEKKKER